MKYDRHTTKRSVFHNPAFQAITKKDKTCYMAWIMIAACAQELKQFNQGQYALNKAIELDENQPLAYQVRSFSFLSLIVFHTILHALGSDTIRRTSAWIPE